MFATILASMSLSVSMLATLQSADMREPRQPAAVQSSALYAPLPGVKADKEHLAIAKRAMANGDFDIARREFTAAAAADRAAGELPVEAVHGLAHALYSQSYTIEAALALQKLVDEATARGDVNTAALALADAIWLNSDAGRRTLARNQGRTLRKMLKDPGITDETRRLVVARVG